MFLRSREDRSHERVLGILLETYESSQPHEARALAAWTSTFLWYQLQWLFESSRISILNKCRQIGGTYTFAAWALLKAVFFGQPNYIVSKGEDEGLIALGYASSHAQILAALGSKFARVVRARATSLEFASGGLIEVRPSTSGARGYHGNVVLDEYAYHERPKEIWEAAAGATFHGYDIRVLSTPNGIGNDFESFWSNPAKSKNWAGHAVTIWDAIADGMAVDLDHCWSLACGDPRLFGQMFECKFLDATDQYLPTELLREAQQGLIWTNSGATYAGLDVGATVDRTELVVVRVRNDGTRFVIYTETAKRTDYAALVRLVHTALFTYHCVRVDIDATGIGYFPAQQLQQHFGLSRVEPVTFTPEVKECLAGLLFQVLQDRKLKIPPDDEQMVKDLCALRRLVTKAGNIRYDAPHTSEGHADKAWALALALNACSALPAQRTESDTSR
jgi:phage FluMu gp28-like protein